MGSNSPSFTLTWMPLFMVNLLYHNYFLPPFMLHPLYCSIKHDLLVTMKQSILFFSIQRLPVSQAIILSFTAPIMASTVARVTLHEKLKIAEIGGMVICTIYRTPG